MRKIVILTGAGISAESGLGTFRDAGGLWARHRIEDVATPEGFARDPALVHRFYNARRAQAVEARPNPAHAALARLQAAHDGEVVIITQNVDGLHETAGAQNVIHMHGMLSGALCAACDARWQAPLAMGPGDACPVCAARAARPDVVWFGEIPYRMVEIGQHLDEADVFVAIGTSGQVWPAAGFAQQAARGGAWRVEMNLEPSDITGDFSETRLGRASEVVPVWVAEVLGA
ncbi:NAD-dependent deacetylase [Roseovarius azorensis]|uniref:NAD-dependent protein deacylase n=1 Tax=Roseovarius azorensis TaxID=1287727 RepID=A0A1H7UH25_9RHOB|nr:NAD-dependent deacylase [Roseovarius azorensis]SEL96044.1 NAD-dependent deacetylase [Roseovarius azorensis]